MKLNFTFQGATLQYNDETGALEIARILHGGAADRSGERFFLFGCGCASHKTKHFCLPTTVLAKLLSVHNYLHHTYLLFHSKEIVSFY